MNDIISLHGAQEFVILAFALLLSLLAHAVSHAAIKFNECTQKPDFLHVNYLPGRRYNLVNKIVVRVRSTFLNVEFNVKYGGLVGS